MRSGDRATRLMSRQRLHSLMLTIATNKLSTGTKGQIEDAASSFQVVRAVSIESSPSHVMPSQKLAPGYSVHVI